METMKSNVNSNIRVLHALPKAPNVDFYGNGLLIAKDIAFSKISQYLSLTPGTYKFQIFKTGFYDIPLYTQTLTLRGGDYFTISIVSLGGQTYFFILRDDNSQASKPPSFLRFINLSPNSPLLSLSLPNSNSPLFNAVEYLETTNYCKLSSGIYNFQVNIASDQIITKFIRNITLDNKKLYTIYIIGLFNSDPRLGYLFVQDGK